MKMNISQAIAEATRHLSPQQEIVVSSAEIDDMQAAMNGAGYSPDYCPDAHRKLAEYVLRSERGDNRGLFLYGNCGTGKTMFLTKFVRVKFRTATDIQKRYAGKGLTQEWEEWVHGHYNDTYVHLPPEPIIIDDLGTEPTSKRFGETREILEAVISARYKYWQQSDISTHITSNLSGQQLDAKYGRRITDRIREMCVPIKFEGRSARGNNKEADR